MSMPVYLSSTIPRWQPATEADIQTAIDNSLIEETHYLDVKRELKPGASANKELARDMASFAIDGGTIIMGIDEDKATGALSLAPTALFGLPERVEQVARSIIDAPLEVVTTVVVSASNPAEGYLLIHVPPSALAPHMVDNRYIGRGDKTKIYLSDSEVVRLHSSRGNAKADGIELLRYEMSQDPFAGEGRVNAHLFLLAEPVSGREGMLLDLLSGVNAQARLNTFQKAAYAPEVKSAIDVSGSQPELIRACYFKRVSRGLALTSSLDELSKAPEDDAAQMEVHEDGGIRLYMGRLSAVHSSGEGLILEKAAVAYARQLVALALAASEEAGYFGNWTFALGATDLKGRCAYAYAPGYINNRSKPRYETDEYVNACTVTYAELMQAPGRIAERLVGKLLRSLGVIEDYANALSD